MDVKAADIIISVLCINLYIYHTADGQLEGGKTDRRTVKLVNGQTH